MAYDWIVEGSIELLPSIPLAHLWELIGQDAQRQIGAPVTYDQQDPVLERQAPRPSVADHIGAPAPQSAHELQELTRAQPR